MVRDPFMAVVHHPLQLLGLEILPLGPDALLQFPFTADGMDLGRGRQSSQADARQGRRGVRDTIGRSSGKTEPTKDLNDFGDSSGKSAATQPRSTPTTAANSGKTRERLGATAGFGADRPGPAKSRPRADHDTRPGYRRDDGSGLVGVPAGIAVRGRTGGLFRFAI
jgi:hypothetical protein